MNKRFVPSIFSHIQLASASPLGSIFQKMIFSVKSHFFVRGYTPHPTPGVRKSPIFLLYVGALNFLMAHQKNYCGANNPPPQLWRFLSQVFLVVLGLTYPILASWNTIKSLAGYFKNHSPTYQHILIKPKYLKPTPIGVYNYIVTCVDTSKRYVGTSTHKATRKLVLNFEVIRNPKL